MYTSALQVGASLLAAHVGDEFGEEQGHEELTLWFGQMGQVKDGPVGLARRSVPGPDQELSDVQGLAFPPRGEGRRGNEAVQLQSQVGAIAGWDEGVEFEDAELAKRRLLNLNDQRGEIQVLSSATRRFR